jgi:hypothetical protein
MIPWSGCIWQIVLFLRHNWLYWLFTWCLIILISASTKYCLTFVLSLAPSTRYILLPFSMSDLFLESVVILKGLNWSAHFKRKMTDYQMVIFHKIFLLCMFKMWNRLEIVYKRFQRFSKTIFSILLNWRIHTVILCSIVVVLTWGISCLRKSESDGVMITCW